VAIVVVVGSLSLPFILLLLIEKRDVKKKDIKKILEQP